MAREKNFKQKDIARPLAITKTEGKFEQKGNQGSKGWDGEVAQHAEIFRVCGAKGAKKKAGAEPQ